MPPNLSNLRSALRARYSTGASNRSSRRRTPAERQQDAVRRFLQGAPDISPQEEIEALGAAVGLPFGLLGQLDQQTQSLLGLPVIQSTGPYGPEYFSNPNVNVGAFLGGQDLFDEAPPVFPPLGNGGGPTGPGEIIWEEIDVNIPDAPDWWKALAPSQWTPTTEYIALSNLLLPFLSPEDQRTISSNIFSTVPKYFEHLDPERLTIPPPPDITPSLRSKFQTAQRAQYTLNALENIANVTGRERTEFGPGYNYLRQVADVLADFGGRPPTKAEQQAALGALDPLLAQGKGSRELGAFGPLARALTQPFFSAGLLRPISQTRAGERRFGAPNPALF